MGIPDNHHVMRHAPYGKLLKDAEGNVYGLLPQAFRLREVDNGKLSVNWLEYFEKPTHQENIVSTVQAIRSARDISKTAKCAFGVGKVEVIKEVCVSCGAKKVDIVYSKTRDNKSHSSIIRLPEDDLKLLQLLADTAFDSFVQNKDIP